MSKQLRQFEITADDVIWVIISDNKTEALEKAKHTAMGECFLVLHKPKKLKIKELHPGDGNYTNLESNGK